jgi:hypothetical protein
MSDCTICGDERFALRLSLREWLIAVFLITALLAVVPSIPFRPRSPVVERDYRIPYSLSTRYAVYRRFTTLAAAQFPTIIVGDSVIWGQCALHDQTLSHHLNELTKQPRFANAGLDGMHPVALVELIEHHAPGIERKNVILHFDPLWLLSDASDPKSSSLVLNNRPGLMPRLAAGVSGAMKDAVASAGQYVLRAPLLHGWTERLADARMDFLAWSLDHPYEGPLRAISSTLPPSEDSHPLRLTAWDATPGLEANGTWGDPDTHPQWKAFERLISLLELRGNRVLVLVGPMNEHMMVPATRSAYQSLKTALEFKLTERGVEHYIVPLLRSGHYSDICHPLAAGYEELARDLLRARSAWLLAVDQPH